MVENPNPSAPQATSASEDQLNSAPIPTGWTAARQDYRRRTEAANPELPTGAPQATSALQATSASEDQPRAREDIHEDLGDPADNELPHDGLIDNIDARLHMALELARRGLSYASINDLAKAVLLMLDIHREPAPHASPLAVAAARGEAPSLL